VKGKSFLENYHGKFGYFGCGGGDGFIIMMFFYERKKCKIYLIIH
jgi:hypothetical protein